MSNQGQIDLVAFQKEDYHKVIDDIFESAKGGIRSASHLVKLVHFNDKYPEYRNVYMDNTNSRIGYFYTGKDWEYVDKLTLFHDIYNSKIDMLLQSYNDSTFINRVENEFSDDEKKGYYAFIKMLNEQAQSRNGKLDDEAYSMSTMLMAKQTYRYNNKDLHAHIASLLTLNKRNKNYKKALA